jgi:hypothetical protein
LRDSADRLIAVWLRHTALAEVAMLNVKAAARRESTGSMQTTAEVQRVISLVWAELAQIQMLARKLATPTRSSMKRTKLGHAAKAAIEIF